MINIWSVCIWHFSQSAIWLFVFIRNSMASRTCVGCPCPPTVSFVQRIGSALLYAVCSGLITVVNKVVLTSYGYVVSCSQRAFSSPLFHNRFPSFQLLAIGQVGDDCKTEYSLIVFNMHAESLPLTKYPNIELNWTSFFSVPHASLLIDWFSLSLSLVNHNSVRSLYGSASRPDSFSKPLRKYHFQGLFFVINDKLSVRDNRSCPCQYSSLAIYSSDLVARKHWGKILLWSRFT